MTPIGMTLFAVCMVLLAIGFYLAFARKQRAAGAMVAAFGVAFGLAPYKPSKATDTLSLAQFSLRVHREASPKDQIDSVGIAAERPRMPQASIDEVTERALQRDSRVRTDADWLVLAMQAFRSGDNELALRHAHSGLTQPSSGPRVRAALVYRVGSFYQAMGLTEVATERQREALRVDPTLAWPHHDLGLAAEKDGKPAEAIEHYRQALQLEPESSWPHTDLGNLLRKQGNLSEAVLEYGRAIALDPQDAAPHNGLGAIFQAQGKRESAAREFTIAVELDPGSAVSHHNLGVLYEIQGQSDAAIREYHEALRRNPNVSMTHNNLGAIYSSHGKPNEALAELTRAIELDPKNALAHDNLGQLLRKLGKLESATEHLRKAMALVPEDARYPYHLGITLAEAGDGDSAAQAFARALELNPAHREAGQKLAELQASPPAKPTRYSRTRRGRAPTGSTERSSELKSQ